MDAHFTQYKQSHSWVLRLYPPNRFVTLIIQSPTLILTYMMNEERQGKAIILIPPTKLLAKTAVKQLKNRHNCDS